MNLPLSGRFTSVQKDDLAVALGRVVTESESRGLATYVSVRLRAELNDGSDEYGLDADQINSIVNSVFEAILEHGPETGGLANDEVVQAVEDFLCI